METFKTSFKLLKYTFQLKTTLLAAAIFNFVGLATFFVFGKMGTEYSSSFWGPFSCIFVLQSLFNVLYAKSVTASPKFKKIVTAGASLVHAFFMTIAFLIYIVGLNLISKPLGFTYDVRYQAVQFVIIALSLSLYIQVYYRNPIIGFLTCLPVVYLAAMANYKVSYLSKVTALDINDGLFLLLAYALVLCTCGVMYVISRMVYKYSFADNMMKKMLARVK